MLITDLKKHFKKPLKGAIHIGAFHGEEKQWYVENGISPIVWIDANPEYEILLKERYPEDIVIISGVGKENKVANFNIANNGQSSSFLKMGTHLEQHPSVFFVGEISVEIKPMTQIMSEKNIDISKYNFLNVDVQGYELEVLRGFEDTIQSMDYVYLEVNTNYLYKECPLIDEIDQYLKKYNLERVETLITPNEWGDALYIKK
jgi:FkbM family methyltransferase